MLSRMCLFGGVRPRFTIQQLNGDIITRVQSLHFDRYIDETVGFHHRCQNTGSLVSGRSNLEHTVFARKYAAQEMPAIATLGKSFLESGLNHRTPIAPTPAHFE